jgi:tRNA(Ile)-lysidine synthase
MQHNGIEKSFYGSLSLLSGCKGIVLGVSGGPDSMAMLHLFIRARDEGRIDFPIVCATLNHCLRPEAEEEVEGVRLFCEKHGLPFVTERVDINATLPKGESTESHARSCRYEFFNRVKAEYGCTHIATAHNADDNFESIILNMVRGCGIDGLCGISPLREDNNTLRPLLKITKADLTDYCKEKDVPYYIDRTNLETLYRRNFIRNKISPLFKELNPSLEEAIYRLSTSARDDCDLLDGLTADVLIKVRTKQGLSLPKLKDLHPALLARVLRAYVREMTDRVPTHLETEELKELVLNGSTSSKKQVAGADFVLSYGILQAEKEVSCGFEPFIPEEGENPLPKGALLLSKGEKYSGQKNCFSPISLEKALVRTRKEGDYMRTPQGSGKLLKKLYIDKKIPREERPSMPILTLDGEIVWAAGIGTAREYLPKRGESYIKAEYIRKKENIHE